jgi:hypothetical protein
VPTAGWPAACQGQCRTGDGRDGDPVTGADADRRLRRSGAARRAPTSGDARPRVARLLDAAGLPQALRTDHGPRAPRPRAADGAHARGGGSRSVAALSAWRRADPRRTGHTRAGTGPATRKRPGPPRATRRHSRGGLIAAAVRSTQHARTRR